MSISKYVKCRTNHICCDCNEVIPIGSEACYISFKAPKHKEIDNFHEEQIGIEYIKLYYCLGCDNKNQRYTDRFNFDEDT